MKKHPPDLTSRTLTYLLLNEPANIALIAKRVGADPDTVTRHLKRAEALGYLTVTERADHQRGYRAKGQKGIRFYGLSDKGRVVGMALQTLNYPRTVPEAVSSFAENYQRVLDLTKTDLLPGLKKSFGKKPD